MPTAMPDPGLEQRLLDQRKAWGGDRYDEVWEGIHRMAPFPNNEHQTLVSEFDTIFRITIGWQGRGEVHPGANVSDRVEGWEHNYRVPDVAVFLSGSHARNCGEFWHGGPDFLVEIVSSQDDTREKIPFYAKIGVREMLIVERDPWALELLRLEGVDLQSVGRCEAADPRVLSSQVLPFTFRLVEESPRMKIEVRSTETNMSWRV